MPLPRSPVPEVVVTHKPTNSDLSPLYQSFCLFTLISARYVCFPKSGFVQCILCVWRFSLYSNPIRGTSLFLLNIGRFYFVSIIHFFLMNFDLQDLCVKFDCALCGRPPAPLATGDSTERKASLLASHVGRTFPDASGFPLKS